MGTNQHMVNMKRLNQHLLPDLAVLEDEIQILGRSRHSADFYSGYYVLDLTKT